MQSRALLAALVLGTALVFVDRVHADADSAKKDLAQAQSEFDTQDYTKATTDLQLAEADLDGVDDATKAQITKDIAALRQKMTDIQSAGQKEAITKDLDSRMATAKDAIPMEYFSESDKDITDFLSKDDTKAAIGQEAVDKYTKTLATYRKLNKINVAKKHVEDAKTQLDQAETDWATKKKLMETPNPDAPGDAQAASDDFGRTLDGMQNLINSLPPTDPACKAQINRYTRLQKEYNGLVFKAKAAETYSRLKDSWDSYADDHKGWENETTGPSFDDILHNQGDDMDALKAPKTLALISRTNNFLEELVNDDAFNALKDSDPPLKAMVDKMKADRQTAWDKMAKFASAILDQAEKATLTQDMRDRLDRFATDNLRLDLEGSDQQKALTDRARKLVLAYDAKNAGDAATAQKLYDDLVAQGGKVFPSMAAKFQASDDFDSNDVLKKIDNFKGKQFHFKNANNRMGWDFSPGNGYQFAMSVDGIPICGKYSMTVENAVKDISKRTGKDFSDEPYEIVGEIVDVGPVIHIARTEGTVKADGETVGTVTAEHNEPVQAIRMNIVALHVGPVAAAADQGMVDPTGNIVPAPQP